MFGIGMPEMIIILIIALIVIGPQKLPELAKSLGKGLAEFKKASEDFQKNVQEEARKTAEEQKEPSTLANKTEQVDSNASSEARPAEKTNIPHA